MKKRLILFVLLGLLFISIAITITFLSPEKCGSFDCFKEAMKKCSKAKYMNEADEATWKYEILGLENKECKVEVTLLQIKTGSLDMERMNGYNMECRFPKGLATYPEKDLNKCTGRLKEEMQTIVISKLYKYILENLSQIKDNLGIFAENKSA